MSTQYWVDWAPFSSPAIQTLPIKTGVLDVDELSYGPYIGLDRRIEAVDWVLRLDGIYLFAITYRSALAAERAPSWDSITASDAIKVSDYLRRLIFGFAHLPSSDKRAAAIFHAPTRIEDLRGANYLGRLEAISAQSRLPTGSLREWLVAIARDDMALAVARRHTTKPLRSGHCALLHLKAQMGRRKNEIEKMLKDQEAYESKRWNRFFPSELILGLAAVVVTLIGVLIYELIIPIDLAFSQNARAIWEYVKTLDSSRVINWLPLLVSIAALRLLHWWYTKSYRRNVFVLTNGIIYFLNCSHYGASVSKLYERVANSPELTAQFGAGPFYPQIRSFETTAEELKTRLHHVQMHFRDLGIRYALIAAVCALIARYFGKA